jgi:aryl-alcohol dehydrogenase-like predicted oxidoreductase
MEEAAAIIPLASIQNSYSFHHRGPEQDGVLDKCRELGLALLPYSPLGG